MSPAVEKTEEQSQSNVGGGGGDSADGARGNRDIADTSQADGVSYAVAIYPYMAEQDDEFDVVVYVLFVVFAISLLN